MSKLDPHLIGRPKADWTCFVEVDPRCDQPLELYLRPLDPLQEEQSDEFAAALIRLYITGGWIDDDGKTHKEPYPLSAVDGEVLALTPEVLLIVARLERMQGIVREPLAPIPATCAPPHPKPDVRYTAEELLALAVVVPSAWRALLGVYRRFTYGGEGWQGKDSAEPTG